MITLHVLNELWYRLSVDSEKPNLLLVDKDEISKRLCPDTIGIDGQFRSATMIAIPKLCELTGMEAMMVNYKANKTGGIKNGDVIVI